MKDIKVAISRKYSVPVSDQKLQFHERELGNDELVADLHITDNDIVILDSIAQEKVNEIMSLLIRTPVEKIPDLYAQNKEFHDSISVIDPAIVSLITSGDTKQLLRHLLESFMNLFFRAEAQANDSAMDEEDEMDPEVQRRELELIHNQNLALTRALPLSHKSLHLYVKTRVNDVLVNFVIDTGAQFTCVTSSVAEAAFLKRAMDEKLQAEVRGVGSSTTDGLLNAFDVCIEDQYFATSSLVLPSGKGPDVCLLGLDFLKAYKGVIDVSRDVLTLEIDGQKVETRLYERQYADPLKEINEDEQETEMEEWDAPADEMNKDNETMDQASGNVELIEKTAEKLQELGFSLEDSRAASLQANGDIELAIELLNNPK